MTQTLTPSATRSDRARRATALLALVSGAALVVDTVTITVLNAAFDPLDSILFFTGFLGLWLTLVALAVTVSARWHGGRRVVGAVATFVVAAGVLGVVSTLADQVGRHVFSPANRGLHGEWSFFSIGVCLLLIGLWTSRRNPQSRP